MGQPSFAASNAVIYLAYGLFLVLGTGLAWRMRNNSKQEFLAGNKSQTALPLAINFIAAGLGSGVFFSYPQLATLAGVQGVVIYALASSLPRLAFAPIGSAIRRKCPEGFVLTEWTRQRYGIAACLFLSFMTLVTLFIYMIAELSAVGQVVTALTGLDGLPVMIVQCVVTTIYTSMGGFKISFLTDVIQGSMVVGLVVIATITIGAKTKIDPSLIESSGLLKPTLLGWQLLYIFPVCIFTNQFFLSSFWLRVFASKTDRDLWISTYTSSFIILIALTLIGATGLLAAWSGAWPGDPPQDGSVAFFLLLSQLPNWVVGIVLLLAVCLSIASFDSLQSAMVSSASNDLFRNRLNIWWIRAAVVLIIVPVIVLALKAPSILQLWLISDLVSSSVIPVLVLGLSDWFYWWRGFEVVVGGLGGILTVFIFGTVYYGDAQKGANLILIQQGLTSGDWAVFGAFVAAPVGSLLWGFAACALRLGYKYVLARMHGRRFDGLDRPVPAGHEPQEGVQSSSQEDAVGFVDVETSRPAGKFF